ncbi:MAG: protein kinase [Myxococcales bacterium]|nr:protein kinase [Myxococcota bacterium]MDW8282603.1 protein kinase [Myxococcales bacterium]
MPILHRPPRASLIGRTLAGDYVIERQLGDGGMGVVYAARHTRLPARFAIKVLHRELGRQEEVFRRFRHEAEVLAALRHPNIVQVIDFNRLADGTIYLVMEYLEGEDLEARIRRWGLLPLQELLPIIRQVASALQAAHRHGVVHRDLKPKNVFLARVEHGDRVVEQVKVLDFGVSKIRRDGEADLTRVGRILGTPQFMSPEQARGQSHLIDARADQFALGAIVYYGLSGQLPFAGTEARAVLYQVLHQNPPPLGQVARVPEPVARVVERALCKDPAGRFPSLSEFVAALEEAAQVAVEAGAPSGPREVVLVQPARRSFPEGTLVLAPGGDATVLTSPSTSGPRPTDSVTQLAALSTTLSGGSGTLEGVSRQGGRRALAGALALCAAGFTSALLILRAPSHPTKPPQANLPTRQPSPPALPAAPPAARGSQSPAGAKTLSQLLQEGHERLRSNDLAGARRSFEAALGIDPYNTRALAGLGEIEMELRSYGAALRWLRQAAQREPDNARYHQLLCQVRFRLGDPSGARAACTRALRLEPDNTDARLMLRSLRR